MLKWDVTRNWVEMLYQRLLPPSGAVLEAVKPPNSGLELVPSADGTKGIQKGFNLTYHHLRDLHGIHHHVHHIGRRHLHLLHIWSSQQDGDQYFG